MKYFVNDNDAVVQSLDDVIACFRAHYEIDDLDEMRRAFATHNTETTIVNAFDVNEIRSEFESICAIFNALRINDSYVYRDSDVMSIEYRRVQDN